MSDATIRRAELAGYSSVVGQPIMLLNKAGACIGQLALIGAQGDYKAMTAEVAGLINGDALRAEVGKLTAALAPFAKVGALFDDREIMDDGFQIGDCYIFQPSAGEEYWLTGDHLRAAAKAMKGGAE